MDYAQGKAKLRLLRDLPGFPADSVLHGQFLLQEEFVLTLVAIPDEQT